ALDDVAYAAGSATGDCGRYEKVGGTSRRRSGAVLRRIADTDRRSADLRACIERIRRTGGRRAGAGFCQIADSGRSATRGCSAAEKTRRRDAADARLALLAETDGAVATDAFDGADVAERSLRARLPALIGGIAAAQRAYERAVGCSRIACI